VSESRSQGPTNINRWRETAPSRWFAPLIEQAKRLVAEIAKYPNRPETIRVSLFPRGHHTYADVRVYLAGKPTGKGLVIHLDLLPQVIAALQQTLHEDWGRLYAQDSDRDGEPTRGEGYTEVQLPPDFW
jgi:hypothetical protein